MDEETLIAEYIEEHPGFPGPADAWLRESGVPVWALVAYYHGAAAYDAGRVAEDYEVPLAAVEAALAYYRRHRSLIDNRIAANAA
ncbi:MAG TPA: hypothetical protein VKZ60_10625 [Chloroflexota bacterium]|nr:hypothetical protein [Chloroflexota bacterium]